MTTLNLHPWNFMPTEILEHVFSFLPLRDRLNVSRMCKVWATAVSSAPVWSFTEVHCDLDETEQEAGGTSISLLKKIHPFIGHIRYLKIVLDTFLELNRMLACTILDVMARKSHRLQGLQIMCYGNIPSFWFGHDLLLSLTRLFQDMEDETMQHVDFRHMSFALNNSFISLVGRCSPNLRTLILNNHVSEFSMLRTETIVEVLSGCPKLAILRISYFALSRAVFQELLGPNRDPFKYLELFCDGLDSDIPEDCWASVRERHPNFRVGLEFAPIITLPMMRKVIKPYVPISQLRFNSFTNTANQVMLVANHYAGTLEKLVLYSRPSIELDLALIELAKACSLLKEIHCFFNVGQGVEEAFRCHCPHLKRYTLSSMLFFPDNPPTVVL